MSERGAGEWWFMAGYCLTAIGTARDWSETFRIPDYGHSKYLREQHGRSRRQLARTGKATPSHWRAVTAISYSEATSPILRATELRSQHETDVGC
jgi:hypothetical protein